MPRTTLIRTLLALVLAAATVVDAAQAQVAPPPNTPPIVNTPPIIVPPPVVIAPPAPTPPPVTFSGRSGSSTGGGGSDSHSGRNVGVYVLGALVVAIVVWVINNTVFAHGSSDQGPPPYLPPPPQPQPSGPPPQLTQFPPGTGASTSPRVARLRSGFNQPPAGETQFVQDEVLYDIPTTVPAPTLRLIAAQLSMTPLETVHVKLTGRTLQRWHIDDGQPVSTKIQQGSGIPQFAGGQPNYLYLLMEDAATSGNSEQYAPEKLEATEAHRLATGNRILVAVIDSGVDPSHPDLAGAIAGHFDPAGEEQPHPHGTGMAGAIAARGSVLGIAPRAELLTVRAFSSQTQEAEGTTLNIIKGLDWAAEKGARVVNMSFAGPADPRLSGVLAKANAKGMVLIAAAGNAGPNSPPLYPAADPNVIAVTATDTHDALFSGANRGKHIAVAAPGVDVLVPAPDSTYQLTTGTSVAAAEVSGVVAMLIERNPALTPKDVRRILMRTAKHLGPSGDERDFGAGLVNALQAVKSAKPGEPRRGSDNEPGCRSGQTAPCPAGRTSMHGGQ